MLPIVGSNFLHIQGYLPQTPDSCVPAGSGNEGLYVYNAAGMRVFKDAGHRSFYVNQNYTEKGPNRFKHVFIGNQRLLTKKAENSANSLESLQWYSHGDHLSSSSYITNAAGELQEYLGYFPQGETWVREHPTQPVDYTFTGKEFDSETGYYYFGARYYDPRVSTWISTDPAFGEYLPTAKQLSDTEKKFEPKNLKGSGGVYNSKNIQVFGYVGENPLTYVDPNGKFLLDTAIAREYLAQEGRNAPLPAGFHVARESAPRQTSPADEGEPGPRFELTRTVNKQSKAEVDEFRNSPLGVFVKEIAEGGGNDLRLTTRESGTEGVLEIQIGGNTVAFANRNEARQLEGRSARSFATSVAKQYGIEMKRDNPTRDYGQQRVKEERDRGRSNSDR